MSAEDVDVGNYVIGHHSQQDGPIHMKSPKEMSPIEWARHKVTHLPYHCSCPPCVAGKKPNLHHRRSGTCRRLPHVLADYCYLRDSVSDTTITVLVVHILPFRVYFATVVDAKGPDRAIIRRLARLIRECGLTHYTYRSDRGAALRVCSLGGGH